MNLDISKELSELWKDVYHLSKRNGYIVDTEFNVISLYHEIDSKLYVTKIIAGRDRHVKKINKLVFDKTKAVQIEEYEMVGIDSMLPIWRGLSE